MYVSIASAGNFMQVMQSIWELSRVDITRHIYMPVAKYGSYVALRLHTLLLKVLVLSGRF